MPKIKIKKGSASLDMTAMCDVAFLLLTFFVLTAKAKPIEPVIVDTPSSVVEIPVKDINVIQLMIDKDGRVFYGMDNFEGAKERQIEKMNEQFKFNLSPEEKKNYINGGPIGVPFTTVKAYLASSGQDKTKMEEATKGIPLDTGNTELNQLKDWLVYGRAANPKASITIKADANTPINAIKLVMKTLKKQDVMNYSLITNLEGMPTDLPKQ
jgi:biopolymer transport protein ExbD